jgi:hypothetical protein
MKVTPIANDGCYRLKEGVNIFIFLYFKFEFRKGRTIKGNSITLIKCATKCSYFDQNILIPQLKQQYNQFLHPTILAREAVPLFKGGNVAHN